MLTKLQRRSDGAVETPDGLFAVNIREVHFVDDEGMNVLRYHANMFSPQTVVKWPQDQYAIIDPVVAGWLLRNGKAYGLTDDELDAYNEAVDAENGEDKKAADKAAADKAAADKAAADKAAADKAAADKAAADKAAADKAAADKAAADRAAADQLAADKAAADQLAADKAAADQLAADKAAAEKAAADQAAAEASKNKK